MAISSIEGIKSEDFVQIPGGVYVSAYNFPDERGEPRTEINWYDAMLTAHVYGLDSPTSKECGDARLYLQEHEPEREELFITGPCQLDRIFDSVPEEQAISS